MENRSAVSVFRTGTALSVKWPDTAHFVCLVPCKMHIQVCNLAALGVPPCHERAHTAAPRVLRTSVVCSMLCCSASCPTQCMPGILGQLNVTRRPQNGQILPLCNLDS